MKSLIIIFLTLNLLNISISQIPNWKFENLAIDLMTENPHPYNLYSDSILNLNKTITKNDNEITSEITLNYGGNTRQVEFESIESHYEGKININYLVCPNGKFHPRKIDSSGDVDIIPYSEYISDNWNLRCYWHDTGYFLIFYANNGEKNLVASRDSGANWIKDLHLTGELYDFKLTQGTNGNNGEYPIMYIANIGGENLKLLGRNLVLKSDSFNMNGGPEKYMCKTMKNTQAFFLKDSDIFYFITYDETNFESGYSTTSSIDSYTELSNFAFVHNSESPFQFVDNIEIKEVNLIRNSQYAYYEVYNKDKDITYHGLIDIKLNKILYNFAESINTFIPYSTTEMLAITPNSAYKICILKNGNSCSSTCSSGNLVLDIEGNKCGDDCGDNKIKLMPKEICIKKSDCDTDYYTLNEDDTECGLCSEFYSETKKYKLINTDECVSTPPSNTEDYKANLFLLKCKTNYHLDNKQCLPDTCYERCNTCSEISSDINDQKCLSCNTGYELDHGNCVTPPTTVIINPSTTVIRPPTTIITPPTTIIKPPTTIITPPTTIIRPPTTIITPPTTVIIPPTTGIIPPPPTTMIREIVTTIPSTIPIIKPEIKCSLEKCLKCNDESQKLNLCLSCDEEKGYKKVNYTIVLTQFVDCLKKEDPKLKNFYYNKTLDEYRPCYKTCKTCLIGGDAEAQHCLECATNYMLRPGYNPKNNCVAYSEFYYIDSYNQYKSLKSLNCPEEAKYIIKEKKCCISDCKKDDEYKYLYNGNCLKTCPEDTKNNSFICIEYQNKSYLSVNDLNLKENDNLNIVENLVKNYISEFNYTQNHVSLYDNDFYNILLYKNPQIINDLSLKTSKVDFNVCYEKVKSTYNIEGDLVISVVDKKSTNNPSSYYSFFHPRTGKKLDAENICKNETIVVKENLTTILNENDTKYELQSSLANQGINIFDINDPFYTDLCFDFKNPKKRDIPLSDRIKDVFPNITLCGDGCQTDRINLEDMTASCNCKFNDITNNQVIKDNAVLDSMVGEIFDLINSSNILVVKCYKYIFKYFTSSIGGILTCSLIALNTGLTILFFLKQFGAIKNYIKSLTKKYLSYLSNQGKNEINNPPKKDIKNKDKRKDKNINYKKYINVVFEEEKSSDILDDKKNEDKSVKNDKNKEKDKKSNKKNEINDKYINAVTTEKIYAERNIDQFIEEYLEDSPDEMEYDDAIKKDKRTFCEYFLENLKEKQIIANTFIAEDPIKSRAIKIILFNLNIILYFVINGLFISESYISELYNLNEEDENFFSFLPRSVERLIYTTLVSIIIGYITSFFFLEEKKIKGIFRRDIDNKDALKQNIINLVKTLKKRYISFIILVFVILFICLYYLLCFNYVYPKTQMEWIKSSIAIIIVIQILSVLLVLLETIIRFISFMCESEKLFKLSKFIG